MAECTQEILASIELAPEVLRRVFTSKELGQRLMALYKQFKERKIPGPNHEQIFFVFEPRDNQVYVSPIEFWGVSGPPIKGSPFWKRTLKFLSPIRIPDSPIIIASHTHHPIFLSPRFTGREPMIIPSAMDELGMGDLYTFIKMREVFKEKIIRRPIQMVITQGIHAQYPIEFLLVQETEERLAIDKGMIVFQLRKAQKEGFRNASTQQKIIDILHEMGYKTCLVALPEERFTSPSIFSPEDLEKISQFAY